MIANSLQNFGLRNLLKQYKVHHLDVVLMQSYGWNTVSKYSVDVGYTMNN